MPSSDTNIPNTNPVPNANDVGHDESSADLNDIVDWMISQGTMPIRANSHLILSIRKNRQVGTDRRYEGIGQVTEAAKISNPKAWRWSRLMNVIALVFPTLMS